MKSWFKIPVSTSYALTSAYGTPVRGSRYLASLPVRGQICFGRAVQTFEITKRITKISTSWMKVNNNEE
jgi:hypothetical protein